MVAKEHGPLWAQIARDEIGKRGTDYRTAATTTASADDSMAAAAFVSWCLEIAGEKSAKSCAARSYLKWGRASSSFAVGSIVVIQQGDKHWQSDIGIVDAVLGANLRVISLGADGVACLAKFPKSRIIGNRWPSV